MIKIYVHDLTDMKCFQLDIKFLFYSKYRELDRFLILAFT